MGRPRVVPEADIPSCPKHGLNFRRSLDGTYGSHRRQRFRCYDAGRGHSFINRLPRQVPASHRCPTCEQSMALPLQGFETPRQHRYSARDIASALIAVGSGASYMSAARTLRRTTGRRVMRHGKSTLSSDASLVMDWTEVFAPMLGEKLLPRTWPSASLFSTATRLPVLLLLDDLPFHVRSWKTGAGGIRARKQSGRRIFSILAAAHQDGDRLEIIRLHAVPTATSEARWQELLESVPIAAYPPPVVLSDEGPGLPAALRKLWPGTTVQVMCVYHLKAALEREFNKYAPPTTPVRKRLYAGIANALRPPATNWTTWSADALRLHVPRLSRFIKRKSARITQQVGWSYWPVSIGALELRLQVIKAMLDRRRWSYRNAKRMDRLLTLIALHLNEADSVERYSELIRQHLLAHAGHPELVRHAVYDPAHHQPSLRRP